jgi:Trypsin-like peptidase domain
LAPVEAFWSSGKRLVITTAHCLPHIPEPHPARYLEENTYGRLLAPLGEEPEVWAECVFCDVITDLAVLGAPDNQDLYDEHAAYEALTEDRPALLLGDIPPSDLREHPLASHPVHVLGLDGEWARGMARHLGGSIMLEGCRVESGMSGSPIINERGEAVGVISTGAMNPRLTRDLPGWLAPAPAIG